MTRAGALLLAACAGPAFGQGALTAFAQPVAEPASGPLPTLSSVLDGATSVTPLASAYILVVKPGASYICAINLNPSYFATLASGSDPDGRVLPPGALCVPTDRVVNLGDGR